MKTPFKDLLSTSLMLKVDAEVYDKSKELFDKIGNNFLSEKVKWPIADYLNNFLTFNHDNAWRFIKHIDLGSPVVVFSDQCNPEDMILFHNVKDLYSVLEECLWFDVFITDEKSSFLICYECINDNLTFCGDVFRDLPQRDFIVNNNIKISMYRDGFKTDYTNLKN